LALIAAATAFTLDRLRRRQEEEAALREEMARRNAAAEAKDEADRIALAAAIAAAAATAEAAREEAERRSKLRREELLEMEESLNPPASEPQPAHALQPGYGEAAAWQQDMEALRQSDVYQLWRHQEAAAAFTTTVGSLAAEDNAQQAERTPAHVRWQRTLDWLRDSVNRLVLRPPSFLSVSYNLQVPGTALPSYALDEWITYQPSAQNLLASITYQQVSARGDISYKVTSNPTGRIDFNFANGRITFHGNTRDDGTRVDWFVQPGSLSYGSITSVPLDETEARALEVWDTGRNISVTAVDVDLGGPNWASLKVSHGQGSSFAAKEEVEIGDFERSMTQLAQIEMSVHRYPRIVVGVVAGVVIVKIGVALVALAPAIGPVLQGLGGAFGFP
jgi:hypothetical protein